MKIYRYPPRALVGDYIRSGVGVALGLGLLLSAEGSAAIIVAGGGILLLFALFGLRTLQRHVVRIAVSDEEICNAGFTTKTLPWKDLSGFKLRYYGTRKQERGQRGGGFMQLTLAAPGQGKLTYESSLPGFTWIAWRGAKAIRDGGHSMDPASAGNLLAIGLDADGERPPPAEEG